MTNEIYNTTNYYDDVNDEQDDNDIWTGLYDGSIHCAQGVSLGWSDEMAGLFGGVVG